MHALVDGDGLHDVAQQGAWPGEVPKEVERLPDEAVAEEFLLVVDEMIVCGQVLMAPISRARYFMRPEATISACSAFMSGLRMLEMKKFRLGGRWCVCR